VIESDELQIRLAEIRFSQVRFRKVSIAQIGLPEASLGKEGAIRLDVAQFEAVEAGAFDLGDVFISSRPGGSFVETSASVNCAYGL